MILKIDAGLRKIDLQPYLSYAYHEHGYLVDPPGVNHCPLLAYFSSQLPDGAKVADLGTMYGHSAIALAYNPRVQVTTYDIVDHIGTRPGNFKEIPNIQFVHDDCKNNLDKMLDHHIILLDIAPHDGIQEREVITGLQDIGYRGIAICDDIRYFSEEMKAFWAEITLLKYDATTYGHFSGTGIVVFDKDFVDVSMAS